MKIYRVHLWGEDRSVGYQYFTSRREATSAIATWRRNKPGPEQDHHASVEEIDVEPTKAGILAALNQYGGHADNG